MFTVGYWYFTKRTRRIIYICAIRSDRAYAIDVEHPDNRGWITLDNIDPKNRDVNIEYNMRRWQPNYPQDDYLED